MVLKATTRNMKEIKTNVITKDFLFRVIEKETGQKMIWIQKAESKEAARLRIPDGYEVIDDEPTE